MNGGPGGVGEDLLSAEASAPDAAAMRALGVRLGRLLDVGDVVGLVGPLGSGKTTFAQGLAEGLEVPAERHVSSPTFALVNEHPGRVPFVHADLYRLEHEDEIEELGLVEAYDRAAAALEWIDRFPALLPADHLEIRIAPDASGGRRLLVRATGRRSASLTQSWLGPA
jgi:tRNA threonylcarbamoyladenosine biosynthesis protein TsaE